MHLFKNKSYLSKCHTIKNKTSTIINHQISPTKKITPAQFPSISQDSPVFPTEKTRHPLCFPHFFGFWLVGFAALPLRSALPIPSRLIRARSLPRWFQWPRVAQTNLRRLTTASEVSTMPLRSWKVRAVGGWLVANKNGLFFLGGGVEK